MQFHQANTAEPFSWLFWDNSQALLKKSLAAALHRHSMKAGLLVFLVSLPCLNCIPSLVSAVSNLTSTNQSWAGSKDISGQVCNVWSCWWSDQCIQVATPGTSPEERVLLLGPLTYTLPRRDLQKSLLSSCGTSQVHAWRLKYSPPSCKITVQKSNFETLQLLKDWPTAPLVYLQSPKPHSGTVMLVETTGSFNIIHHLSVAWIARIFVSCDHAKARTIPWQNEKLPIAWNLGWVYRSQKWIRPCKKFSQYR